MGILELTSPCQKKAYGLPPNDFDWGLLALSFICVANVFEMNIVTVGAQPGSQKETPTQQRSTRVRESIP